ncbi:ParB/RepB/Spo0J family partition protein [Rhizobium sp. YIM 134829]|uniref:ParB/RepB/Spo0J family partition protein n=1 Tax=Rhizobium sp. YIM 134829 TaxID=3390453 RepID=UPI00397965EF
MVIRSQKQEPPVTFEIHPAANIFPEMTDAEARDLMVDMREHGQREPIVLFQGKVIDGRNRLRACRWLEIEPRTREYHGREEDIVSYVLSLNLHRRHLTDSQRAMVAAKLANMKVGNPNFGPSPNSANLPNSDAAKLLNVSERSVRTAKQIKAKGEPVIVTAVQAGDMSLNEAAKVVQLQPAAQRAVAALPKAERRETLAGNSIEQLGVLGAQTDPYATNRQALCRILADLAELEGTPEQLIAQMPKFLAPKLNKSFRQAYMKMQAMNAVYQNWEFRNVNAD